MNNIKTGSNIAMIGLGYCGCSMVDQGMESIKEQDNLFNNYVPYLVDCSYNFCNQNIQKYDTMNFLTLASGGSGKSRKLAKEHIDKNCNTKHFIYRNFGTDMYDSIYLIASSAGGMGSAGIIEFAKRIRDINSKVSINIIVLIPELNHADLYDLRNTLELQKEITAELEQALNNRQEEIEPKCAINSVVFITNKRRCNSDFDKKIMNLLIKLIEIETINNINMPKEQRHSGYKVILPIENEHVNFDEAVQEAIETSNIVLPDEFFDNSRKMYSLPREEVRFNNAIALFNHNVCDASITKALKVVTPEQDFKFSISEKGESIIIADGYFNKSNKVLPTKAFELIKDELIERFQYEY